MNKLRALTYIGTIFTTASMFTLLGMSAAFAQSNLPSNPIAGRIVFEEKGCTDCHAINGYGSDVGPDLGRDKFYGSFYDLASMLWNHAPQMVVRTDYLKKDWPSFSSEELNSLTSYLFYLRFLGEPGSISKGRRLIDSKQCLVCHSVGGEGARDGIALDQLQEYASPLYIAQVIWNHGPAMQEEMEALGIERPVFGDEDITHIGAFLREFSRGSAVKRHFMSPGNPEEGARLFQTKGCSKCHATEKGKSLNGTDLSEMDLHRSVTAIAGTMWNHGNTMLDVMEEEAIHWPTFEGSEMADLISYLYFYDYERAPGNSRAGQKVFKSKSCSDCHGSGKPYEFDSSMNFAAPVDLVRTMWNHVPRMQELIVTKNIRWPELTSDELRDLYAYLIQRSTED